MTLAQGLALAGGLLELVALRLALFSLARVWRGKWGENDKRWTEQDTESRNETRHALV